MSGNKVPSFASDYKLTKNNEQKESSVAAEPPQRNADDWAPDPTGKSSDEGNRKRVYQEHKSKVASASRTPI